MGGPNRGLDVRRLRTGRVAENGPLGACQRARAYATALDSDERLSSTGVFTQFNDQAFIPKVPHVMHGRSTCSDVPPFRQRES